MCASVRRARRFRRLKIGPWSDRRTVVLHVRFTVSQRRKNWSAQPGKYKRAVTAPTDKPLQLELPLQKKPSLRLIKGEGKKKPHETLASRNAVVRVLVEAGADLLLRRISSERAEEIEKRVDRVLALFDLVDDHPVMMAKLERELAELEALMTETRERKVRSR